jgi:cyanate lyase
MTKAEMTQAIFARKAEQSLSWEAIADKIGMSPVWTTSACLGQNSMPAEIAEKLRASLDLPAEVTNALKEYPSKGSDKPVPTDPLIYRFHEIVQVYGTTIKTLIHETFGDGIMSAIDFTMHIDKVPDPKGDRVKITMNGKFLPYKTW